MLAFPQPRKSESTSHPLDDASAELPVVDLPENSDTMEALLRLSYPRPTFSTFWTFDCAAELLEAAHKYELAYAEATLKQAIAPFVRDQPIQVYAFAARFRMTDLMEATAHACLALPFFWAYIPELENISAGAYHRLLDYRERCKVALGTISHTQWSVKDHRWTWRVCTTCVKHTSSRHVATGACGKCGQATWFSSFWNDVMARLKERPSVVTLLDQTLYDVPSLKKALDCATCRMVMYEQIRKFLALLADEAAKKISEVRPCPTPCGPKLTLLPGALGNQVTRYG
ncbi:hypothetical protein L227DRAFT_170994 [Lentinus tigrinus ALCF2SS1-6]|uniref:BTB domain-containing protein n=1 Tax=Lentinus tigrinus ALCF2SS1-6 TaxID=1328759 RepID=A0A5C2S6Z1_9APHY|nr:hypothetical protein L227DRAFT_170994 [Lentinus tigrinus ALCF2SS1-6]